MQGRASWARRYFERSRRRSSGDEGHATRRRDRRSPLRGRDRRRSARPRSGSLSVSRTLFQPWTRMSGWWLASSASSATWLTNAIAAAKSSNSKSPTRRRRPRLAATRCISSVALCASSSLVPSATEMLFALGLGDQVVAVTHECDHPAEALELPKVTRDADRPGPRAGRDRRARCASSPSAGEAIYELDEERAARARARPDRHAGAVRGLRRLLRRRRARSPQRLEPAPKVISLDPHTLGEVLGDVRTLAAGDRRAGRRRRRSCRTRRARIDRVRARGARAASRCASPRSSGSTRSSSPATGRRS